MVLSNSQMKLSSSIRLEGSYHIVDGLAFFPRFTFLTLLLHLLSRSYIYFFLSLLQITNDVFFNLPPNVVAGVGCTKNHPQNAGISRKNWEELLLGRRGFLDWLWREELCEHLWRIRRWAAAASTRRRRRAAVHRGCFFREEGWLTAPCIAHHHTRTVRRWYTVSWFTKKWDHNIVDFILSNFKDAKN